MFKSKLFLAIASAIFLGGLILTHSCNEIPTVDMADLDDPISVRSKLSIGSAVDVLNDSLNL